MMKVLFAVNLVLLPLLAMGQEEDRGMNGTDISERQECYVPGQCQEYSVNFKRTDDVDLCHKFCGQNEDCSWWSFEPSQNLCLLFANCTESGAPDTAACEDCISGERLCPARECHGAFKCEGIFIDSLEFDHLEDCLKACSDNSECMWFTLEKTHNHCILYEGCGVQNECQTCASGERDCSVGYHGPTEDPAVTVAEVTVTDGNICERITTKEDCEAAATDLGLPVVRTSSGALIGPPYCYYKPGTKVLYFNTDYTAVGSDASCSSNRNCLCKSGGA